VYCIRAFVKVDPFIKIAAKNPGKIGRDPDPRFNKQDKN
jgi:hypothetical protein